MALRSTTDGASARGRCKIETKRPSRLPLLIEREEAGEQVRSIAGAGDQTRGVVLPARARDTLTVRFLRGTSVPSTSD